MKAEGSIQKPVTRIEGVGLRSRETGQRYFLFLDVPKIHHQIHLIAVIAMDFGITLDTSKLLDARRRGVTTEAYESNTPQGGTNEGNTADDILMVGQGDTNQLTCMCSSDNQIQLSYMEA